MSDEWKKVLLEDVADEITVGYVGSMTSEYLKSGVPFLRSKNVEPLNINTNDIKYISEEFHRKIKKSRLSPGDVVIVRTGKPGACAVVPDWLEDANCSDLVIVRCGENINNRFLSYYVNVAAAGHVNAHLVGAVQQHFNVSSARSLCVNLPALSEQKAIAHILGSLDDKIELNRQMNETLEGMAQALFKSWFVDFDPVIDNAIAAGNEIPDALKARAAARREMECDRKVLPEDIRQQFPSSFEYSDKNGWIPEGWSIQPLDEIANYQNGLALQKFRPKSTLDFLPVVKIAQLRKGFADGLEKASPDIKPECIIDNGDVVFSWSGSLLVDLWCGGKAALNQHLFKVTSEVFPRYFFYLFTKHHLEEFQRIAADKAVTMGHIKRTHLNQALCVVPSHDVVASGNCFIDPLVDKQIELKIRNQQIEKLRDTLFPQLLSGTLRIPDAEKLVAEAL